MVHPPIEEQEGCLQKKSDAPNSHVQTAKETSKVPLTIPFVGAIPSTVTSDNLGIASPAVEILSDQKQTPERLKWYLGEIY